MSSQSTNQIKYNSVDIPVEVTYGNAMFDFKKMGINLFKLFEDQHVVQSLLGDDEVVISLWFFYVKDHAGSFEDAVKGLTKAQLETFREVFWQAVVNFTPSPMQLVATEMWKQTKKDLKSSEMILKSSSSDSSQRPE